MSSRINNFSNSQRDLNIHNETFSVTPTDFSFSDNKIEKIKNSYNRPDEKETTSLLKKLENIRSQLIASPETSAYGNSESQESQTPGNFNIVDHLSTFEPRQQTLMLYYIEVYKSMFTGTAAMTAGMCSLVWDMATAKKNALEAQGYKMMMGAISSAVVSVGTNLVGVGVSMGAEALNFSAEKGGVGVIEKEMNNNVDLESESLAREAKELNNLEEHPDDRLEKMDDNSEMMSEAEEVENETESNTEIANEKIQSDKLVEERKKSDTLNSENETEANKKDDAARNNKRQKAASLVSASRLGVVIGETGHALGKVSESIFGGLQTEDQAEASIDQTQTDVAQSLVQTMQQQQQQNISSKEEAIQMLQAIIRTIMDADSAVTSALRM